MPPAQPMPDVSVILPTHNPDGGRLTRTLRGLQLQTLATDRWELVLVDNGSTQPAGPLTTLDLSWHPAARIVPEAKLGLTFARLCGIAATSGRIVIFVDDDNVLDPNYLTHALNAFNGMPRLGAAGGSVRPEFETPPPPWLGEFQGLLALHDQGPQLRVATGAPSVAWPDFAPVGAGLCLRRSYLPAYVHALQTSAIRRGLDRRAGSLASGGDNDIVFTVLHQGGDVAYLPELALTHLIPSGRLDPAYLARLNRDIQRSWVRVLALHGQRPWPAIPPSSVPLRSLRAWFRCRAWRGAVETIRWRGLQGRFLGQGDLFQC